ncbi:MAG: T9SS type A sorting domain-containing protein, partial [Bacteroidota bacterium]
EISSTTLAKDDGGVEDGFSYGFVSPDHYGYFGTAFDLLTSEVLTGVSTIVVPFSGFSEANATFYCLIKAVDADGNIQEENVYKSDPLVAGDYFTDDLSLTTIELPTPVTLEPGKYVFAFGQDEVSGMVAFGLDYSRSDSNYWEKNTFEGVDWVNYELPFTLMIRPEFSDSMATNTVEEQLAETIPLKVFPQPFNESLHIKLDFPTAPTAHLQLFDATGKLWIDKTVDHHQLIREDVQDLPSGMYLLRLQSGPYLRTVKVMKQ